MLNVVYFLMCVLAIILIVIAICIFSYVLLSMVLIVYNALKDCRVRKKS